MPPTSSSDPTPVDPAELPRRLASFPRTWPMPTRWADNDHYGHINNVTYYAYFDTAVNAYLIQATGTDIRQLPAIGLVVETACSYLAPLSFPDQLLVGLAVIRLGTSSIIYRIGLFRAGEQEPAALARFVHVYVDRDEQRSTVPIPDPIRAAVTPLLVRPGGA
jgi:acyl-CoA thioester hydrolase